MKTAYSLLLAGTLLAIGCAGNQTPVAIESSAIELASTVRTASPRDAMIAEIAERFNDPAFSNALFGVKIKSLKTGEVWYEQNAEKFFLPASNQKIPTTAAALLTLGPDYRYETTLSHTGTLSNGVVDGDLVVRGTGDPTIYSRFYSEPTEVFRNWARDLKAQGITRVTGNVIGDDNAWSDGHLGNGWPFSGLNAWYYAEFGPLTFNENYIDFTIIPPATVGGEVKIVPNVASRYFSVNNEIEVVSSGRSAASGRRNHYSNEITYSGRVVAGSDSFDNTTTITNPTLWYATVLMETLQDEGIVIEGTPVDCDDIAGYSFDVTAAPRLITHQSPPLGAILSALMKRSQNMYAENMVYTLGYETTGRGTFSAGRDAIQEALRKIGIEPSEYIFSDGSGLSRYNYLSPNVIIKMYEAMYNSELKDAWWEAQAIAGVDGTIRSRMRGTAAEGNVRGKTGTIANTRSLSGYVSTADGEQLMFSFLCNGHTQGAAAVDRIYDFALERIANYRSE